MQGWRSRAEAWLSGLRTWKFVLVWDTVIVAGALFGVIIGESLWARGVNLSALLGSAVGSTLAATVFAFVARDRMRMKAEQRQHETVTLPRH
jgi:NhaP-type Na+/H+ and K+/H+ antiporter